MNRHIYLSQYAQKNIINIIHIIHIINIVGYREVSKLTFVSALHASAKN